MQTFTEQFLSARLAGTPLVGVQSADPASTIASIIEAINKSRSNGVEPPMLCWDVANGVQWLNKAGLEVCWRVFLKRGNNDAKPLEQELRNDLALKTGNLFQSLMQAVAIPERAVLFVQNAHLFIRKEQILQATWNLRDIFKEDNRVLCLLGPMTWDLPPELSNDTMMLTEPLPTLDALKTLVEVQYANAGIEPKAEDVDRAVDAVCGLAAFPAEQAMATSFQRDKETKKIILDHDALWDRKRKTIETAKGLTVWRGGETMDDIAGIVTAKSFMQLALNGKERPRVIVLLDEFGDAMAGNGSDAGNDTSGVAQEMHGTLLSEMENQQYTGIIFVGVPGSSKSMLAKAAGSSIGVPTIAMDISSMKSKYVGSSNENLNMALAVIRAVSQGRCLMIATCNSVANFSPQLKRRFNHGTWFFDLPSSDEREAIWPLYFKKYGINKKQQMPEDEGWTGADIKQCCRQADSLDISLVEASQFLSPVSRVDGEGVEKLRTQAHNRFLSASYPGFYQHGKDVTPDSSTKGSKKRRLEQLQ